MGLHCGAGIRSGVVCPACRASYEVCADFKSVLHCGTGPDRSSVTNIPEVVNAPQGCCVVVLALVGPVRWKMPLRMTIV